MTYAKLISIGDMTPHGAPLTIEPRSGERHVIMLEYEQCKYYASRFTAIVQKGDCVLDKHAKKWLLYKYGVITMSILSQAYFHNEIAAIARLEGIVWPNGPVCPRCEGQERITTVRGGRPGLRRCGPCKRQFTATVGTVFERSHVPLHKWWQAAHLMASSKKGISAHQLHRTLKVTYKTAWFMEHRLREAMRTGGLAPLGGTGMAVEADETFMSHMRGRPVGRPGTADKRKVLTLIQRGGHARSFHIRDLTSAIVAPIVRQNIARESVFMTDEGRHYRGVGRDFAAHHRVEHNAKEYVRGIAHVNTAESFFALFKRGMRGVYQHCAEKHLHRYLAEFDFRYNNRVALGVQDEARADQLISGIVGKRLTYRGSSVPRVQG